MQRVLHVHNRIPPEVRRWLRPALTGAALLAIIGVLFALREQLSDYVGLGYAGAFLVSLIGAGSMVLPAPAIAVIFVLGGTAGYNPLLVGLAGALGETVGELTGYLLGASTREVAGPTRLYRWLVPHMHRWGVPIMFTLSVIPNPIFDFAGVAAGIAGMPPRIFALTVFAGKTIKMTAFALAGLAGLEALIGLFNALE